MYVVVLSEIDSILDSLQDLLSVCVRDCMGSCFTTHSSETQDNLWQEDLMIMFLVYFKCVYLIIDGLMVHLGVNTEVVWAFSLSLT